MSNYTRVGANARNDVGFADTLSLSADPVGGMDRISNRVSEEAVNPCRERDMGVDSCDGRDGGDPACPSC